MCPKSLQPKEKSVSPECLQLVTTGLHNAVGYIRKGKKVKISLLQAVEAHRFARGQGSHIT
jgi:hypothetical protein